MFRLSGEPSTSNTSTHPIRRSYGTQSAQLAMESAAVLEELCMRDDQYFNLLYKAYDRHGLGAGVNARALNFEDGDTTQNALGRNLELPTERNKSISLFDFRQMDAELARIQRTYEDIELNLARDVVGAENRKPPEGLNNNTTRDNFNPLDSSGSSGHRLPNRERVSPAQIDWSSSLTALSAADARIQRRHSSILADISSILQTLPETSRSAASAAELDTSASSSRLNPAMSVSPAVEQQPTPKPLDLEKALVCEKEPYKCPVCLSCVRNRKPSATMCGHVFCGKCIETALRVCCKCPVCQKMATTHELLRVYI